MIEFNYFKRQYESIKPEIDSAILNVLESGWYVLGEELKSFEENLATFVGTKYSVGVASGTEALSLSLLALDIGVGDEVITTDLTAYPTITAIESIGALPVAVDIDSETGLINPNEILKNITSKTKAVIPVHLYGQAAELDKILAICQNNNLKMIEDCAQAIGAKFKNQTVGTFGDLSCYSFYPTKNLGAYGDAGAICTNSEQLYSKLIMLRNYGQTERYKHEYNGINSRLDEIQAAILNVKIKYLSDWNERRINIASKYIRAFPKENILAYKDGSVFHLFPILVDNRDEFMRYLTSVSIQFHIHYPIPVSKQKAFTGRILENIMAQGFCDKLVSIPICPELSDEEINYIITKVQVYLNR